MSIIAFLMLFVQRFVGDSIFESFEKDISNSYVHLQEFNSNPYLSLICDGFIEWIKPGGFGIISNPFNWANQVQENTILGAMKVNPLNYTSVQNTLQHHAENLNRLIDFSQTIVSTTSDYMDLFALPMLEQETIKFLNSIDETSKIYDIAENITKDSFRGIENGQATLQALEGLTVVANILTSSYEMFNINESAKNGLSTTYSKDTLSSVGVKESDSSKIALNLAERFSSEANILLENTHKEVTAYTTDKLAKFGMQKVSSDLVKGLFYIELSMKILDLIPFFKDLMNAYSADLLALYSIPLQNYTYKIMSGIGLQAEKGGFRNEETNRKLRDTLSMYYRITVSLLENMKISNDEFATNQHFLDKEFLDRKINEYANYIYMLSIADIRSIPDISNLIENSLDKQVTGTLYPSPEPKDENTITPMVATGYYHTVALKSNGTVWTWGHNQYGQLGGETATYYHTTPMQVQNLNNITAISAGYGHTLTLKNDGTVWAWGMNGDGQIGDGTTNSHATPTQVQNLSNIMVISAGYYHSVALEKDGTVWAWGRNSSGELGNGTTISSTTPVQVRKLNNVVAISAGYSHTVALKKEGTVWAWGRNSSGQLVDGTFSRRLTQVQSFDLGTVTAIAAGEFHTVALKNDTTVFAGGGNAYGQLGDGTTAIQELFVQSQNINDVILISAGGNFTVTLKSDGTVWGWGQNDYGQLGNGTRNIHTSIVQAQNLSNVMAIATGYYHTVALKKDGTVWAFGFNIYGQLGVGTITGHNAPTQVLGTNGEGYFNVHN